ncbi:MAG: hypothetical protein AB7Q01_15010 [Gammaproteobacteria bacterium]
MMPGAERQAVDTLPDGKLCHYNRQPCMRMECARWRNIKGMDPQTGQQLDRWDCGDNLQEFLILEQNKLLREFNAELATLRAENYIQMETLLLSVGRPDILAKVKERRDHVRALNRTDELIQERSRQAQLVPASKAG